MRGEADCTCYVQGTEAAVWSKKGTGLEGRGAPQYYIELLKGVKASYKQLRPRVQQHFARSKYTILFSMTLVAIVRVLTGKVRSPLGSLTSEVAEQTSFHTRWEQQMT